MHTRGGREMIAGNLPQCKTQSDRNQYLQQKNLSSVVIGEINSFPAVAHLHQLSRSRRYLVLVTLPFDRSL